MKLCSRMKLGTVVITCVNILAGKPFCLKKTSIIIYCLVSYGIDGTIVRLVEGATFLRHIKRTNTPTHYYSLLHDYNGEKRLQQWTNANIIIIYRVCKPVIVYKEILSKFRGIDILKSKLYTITYELCNIIQTE